MYLSEAFNDSAYLHMQMEFSGGLDSLELCSKQWLLFYFLFSIVVVWEAKRMRVVFRNRCPVGPFHR